MRFLRNRVPSQFSKLFNFKDDRGVGRCMLLQSTFFGGLANVFITGTFYTGFLSENGIDIVNVGIITFIPYMSWILGLFAPKFLAHFKRRRGLMLFTNVFYYTCTILATTIMPRFVSDPGQRTLWFGIFLFIGNGFNALVTSGATAWHFNFIPEGSDRATYFSTTYLVSNLTGTFSALGAALLTDALAGSPYQAQVLVIMRYVSFVLLIISGTLTYAIPKEYPYPISEQIRLRDVIVKPLHNKPFLLTILISVIWNSVGSLNAGTWNYYLLNTVGAPYIVTYVQTTVCAIGGIFLLRVWRRFINRYTWLNVIFVNVAATVVIEVLLVCTTEKTIGLYIIAAALTGLNFIGAQVNFANVEYYNLPKTDTDTYITFYSFVLNICMFLSTMLGTWLLSYLEVFSKRFTMFGIPMHGSQLLCVIKIVGYIALCFYLYKIIPRIRRDTPM